MEYDVLDGLVLLLLVLVGLDGAVDLMDRTKARPDRVVGEVWRSEEMRCEGEGRTFRNGLWGTRYADPDQVAGALNGDDEKGEISRGEGGERNGAGRL